MIIIIVVFVIMYSGIVFGIYDRVMSAKKMKGALKYCLLSPFFLVPFFACGIRLMKTGEIDRKIYFFALRHLNDVMFFYVILNLSLKKDKKNNKQKVSWYEINNDVFHGIQAF